MLAIFINGGSANNLQLPASQSGLDNIGRINAALGAASADNGVQLIDKEDNAVVTAQQLLNLLHALLELTSIFGTGHQHAQLQREYYFLL